MVPLNLSHSSHQRRERISSVDRIFRVKQLGGPTMRIRTLFANVILINRKSNAKPMTGVNLGSIREPGGEILWLQRLKDQ